MIAEFGTEEDELKERFEEIVQKAAHPSEDQITLLRMMTGDPVPSGEMIARETLRLLQQAGLLLAAPLPSENELLLLMCNSDYPCDCTKWGGTDCDLTVEPYAKVILDNLRTYLA